MRGAEAGGGGAASSLVAAGEVFIRTQYGAGGGIVKVAEGLMTLRFRRIEMTLGSDSQLNVSISIC